MSGSPSVRSIPRLAVPLLLLTMVASSVAARAGDCDAVSVALGASPLASCPGLDRSGDGSVSVAEILGGGAGGSPRAPGVVSIDVGTTSGPPGASVSFEVTLDTGGLEVVATQNDIAFDPLTPITGCSVNPDIDKDEFATAHQPFGCTLGVDCTAIRVIVLSFFNLDPIPDGPIYSCTLDIDGAAPPGSYPLPTFNALSSGGAGNPLTTTSTDGAVVVNTPLDHFKCYKVKDLKEPKFAQTTVALSDQFVDDGADVKKPFLLCNPVDKNEEGINNPVDHLVCYKIKTPKLASPPNVEVTNQFGTLKLQAKRSFLLCVPSSKQVLP